VEKRGWGWICKLMGESGRSCHHPVYLFLLSFAVVSVDDGGIDVILGLDMDGADYQ
jgi:hypothetical protein